MGSMGPTSARMEIPSLESIAFRYDNRETMSNSAKWLEIREWDGDQADDENWMENL